MSGTRAGFDWLEPAIIAPQFFNPAVNAIADDDLPFLRRQLRRHMFAEFTLRGETMYDRHGFCMSMADAFGVKASSLGYGRAIVPDFGTLLRAGPARRVAIIVENSDRLISADVQRFMTLTDAIQRSSAALWSAEPRTQLLCFLSGPEPAFQSIEPAAQRRAEEAPAAKVMTSDITIRPWRAPVDFDLGPPHHLLLSHSDWYYGSRGRRAMLAQEQWHCVEADDRLTFIRADDGTPCFEGVFARTPAGMQLVGIRYESDEAARRVSLVADDPFTVFRALCQSLGLW